MKMTLLHDDDLECAPRMLRHMLKPTSLYTPAEQQKMREVLQEKGSSIRGDSLNGLSGLELAELHRAAFPRWFDRYRHAQAA
jgi:hypothetical protein